VKVFIIRRGEKRIEEDKGAVITEKVRLEAGGTYEKKRFIFKRRKDLIIPAPSFEHYWKDHKDRDILWLYEIERGIAYPITPEWEVIDKEGKKYKVFIDDFVVDEKTKKTIALDGFIGHKYYDLQEELIKDLEVDPYKKKGFWERYGNLIMVAIAIVGIILIAAVILQNLNKSIQIVSGMLSKVSQNQVELIKALKANLTAQQQLKPL